MYYYFKGYFLCIGIYAYYINLLLSIKKICNYRQEPTQSTLMVSHAYTME